MKKIEKLNLQTKNLTEENMAKLVELFPEIITEVEKDGELIKTINADKLRDLIGDFATNEEEVYELTWAGKQKSKQKIVMPINKTLRPIKKDSVDFENTENLYIEGDNFEVLKLLQESYLNKVKMIYIDPPYNTGKDFVYKDDFKTSKEEYDEESGAVDEEGNKLFKNTTTNGRFHSDWLSMMYERLRLARGLLSEDGVIFISIDDNEVDNLRKVCGEVFGEWNFIVQLVLYSNPRGRQSNNFFPETHEYVLAYSKDIFKFELRGLDLTKEQKEEYSLTDEKGNYREIGLRLRGGRATAAESPTLHFPLYYDEKNNKLSINKSNNAIEIIPKFTDGTLGTWRWSKQKIMASLDQLKVREVNGSEGTRYDVFQKDYLTEDKKRKPKSLWMEKEINYDRSKDDLRILKLNKVFDYSKPVYLLKKLGLISTNTNKNDIILDFFSGSATTAHAVMQLNAEDEGNRKFIMVQLPEETAKDSEAYKAGYKTICEIGKERIRRASKKIKEDNKDKDLSKMDFGFKVFKLDSSNMKDVYYNPNKIDQRTLTNFKDNIKDDRTSEDLLYQVLIDLAIPISAKIKEEKIKNKTVFVVDDNFLIACFEDKISLEVVKEIAEKNPQRIVFRDSSFKDDKDKVNCYEFLKHKLPNAIIKVI